MMRNPDHSTLLIKCHSPRRGAPLDPARWLLWNLRSEGAATWVFQMELHLSNRLAHPAADRLFGPTMAPPDFRAGFPSDKATHEPVSQQWRQPFQRYIDIQPEPGRFFRLTGARIWEGIREHKCIAFGIGRSGIQGGQPMFGQRSGPPG